jgi:hypothetical protein
MLEKYQNYDGTEHKIIDNFVWYAARKKQYYE